LEILNRLHKAVFARYFLKGAGGNSRYFRTVLVTVLAVITVVFVSLAAAPAPDIIYKNF